jgi:hypothetical protein
MVEGVAVAGLWRGATPQGKSPGPFYWAALEASKGTWQERSALDARGCKHCRYSPGVMYVGGAVMGLVEDGDSGAPSFVRFEVATNTSCACDMTGTKIPAGGAGALLSVPAAAEARGAATEAWTKDPTSVSTKLLRLSITGTCGSCSVRVIPLPAAPDSLVAAVRMPSGRVGIVGAYYNGWRVWDGETGAKVAALHDHGIDADNFSAIAVA